MKPYVSIVIPYFNSPDTVRRLLASIKQSKKAPPYEVIVVDDGSDTENMIRESWYRVIRLKKNRGPAVARNRGVAVAKGTFVVFMDCDVEVFPDTLAQIAQVFTNDPDVVALTGVWVRHQKSAAFFPNFKAIRDWSYWIHERDQTGYYFLFSTRIAAIKKTVFQRLGGFDESYPGPLVEDIELTYRIARRYAIIFAPHVRVRHEFEGFWPIAKKYFWRTYYWSRLYSRRKKFDPVATTFRELVTALTGVGALVAVVFSWWMAVLLFVIHIFLLRKFLWFAYSEKGAWFAVRAVFVGLALYMMILSGGLYYRLRAFIGEA